MITKRAAVARKALDCRGGKSWLGPEARSKAETGQYPSGKDIIARSAGIRRTD
jgi:hypothetical protein